MSFAAVLTSSQRCEARSSSPPARTPGHLRDAWKDLNGANVGLVPLVLRNGDVLNANKTYAMEATSVVFNSGPAVTPQPSGQAAADLPLGIDRPVRTQPRRQDRPAPTTVSVVIPCFNYARFLPTAVHSALSQSGVEVDVVIVDDASTDEALDVARRLAAEHPAVRFLAHETNQGPVATFNDGLALAFGEFLVRLDADDMLTPGALARATELANAYPSVGLVYGHPRHFAGEPPPARTAVRSWTVWPGRQWLSDRCRDGLSVITAPEVVMRRSVVDRVGGQQPLAHSHDMEMWMRIAAFSDVGHVDGPDQAWHRNHPHSLSTRLVDQVKDFYERAAAFDTLFAGPAGAIPEAPALRSIARQAIARDALRSACHRFDRGRADEETVAALTALACELTPDYTSLPEWRALQRRAELGMARVQRRPRYVAVAAYRRLRHESMKRRWVRTGAYGRTRPVSDVLSGDDRISG